MDLNDLKKRLGLNKPGTDGAPAEGGAPPAATSGDAGPALGPAPAAPQAPPAAAPSAAASGGGFGGPPPGSQPAGAAPIAPPSSSGGFGGAPPSSGGFGGAPPSSGGGGFGGTPPSSGGGGFGGAPPSSGGGGFGGTPPGAQPQSGGGFGGPSPGAQPGAPWTPEPEPEPEPEELSYDYKHPPMPDLDPNQMDPELKAPTSAIRIAATIGIAMLLVLIAFIFGWSFNNASHQRKQHNARIDAALYISNLVKPKLTNFQGFYSRVMGPINARRESLRQRAGFRDEQSLNAMILTFDPKIYEAFLSYYNDVIQPQKTDAAFTLDFFSINNGILLLAQSEEHSAAINQLKQYGLSTMLLPNLITTHVALTKTDLEELEQLASWQAELDARDQERVERDNAEGASADPPPKIYFAIFPTSPTEAVLVMVDEQLSLSREDFDPAAGEETDTGIGQLDPAKKSAYVDQFKVMLDKYKADLEKARTDEDKARLTKVIETLETFRANVDAFEAELRAEALALKKADEADKTDEELAEIRSKAAEKIAPLTPVPLVVLDARSPQGNTVLLPALELFSMADRQTLLATAPRNAAYRYEYRLGNIIELMETAKANADLLQAEDGALAKQATEEKMWTLF